MEFIFDLIRGNLNCWKGGTYSQNRKESSVVNFCAFTLLCFKKESNTFNYIYLSITFFVITVICILLEIVK